MAEELYLVAGNVLGRPDSPLRDQLDNRIHHKHGEALLEQTAHLCERHERHSHVSVLCGCPGGWLSEPEESARSRAAETWTARKLHWHRKPVATPAVRILR